MADRSHRYAGRVARFAVHGDRLALHLTPEEHLEGMHRDIDVPLASVTTARID